MSYPACIVFLVSLFSVSAFSMDVGEFIEFAKKNDPATQASVLALESAKSTLRRSELLTAVQLQVLAGSMDDERPTQNPNFQGTRTAASQLSLGLMQRTEYGLSWSLSQNFQKTHIYDAALSAIPVPEYYDSFPKLEVSFSLWRNFLGREVSAEKNAARSQLLSELERAEMNWILQENELKDTFETFVTDRESLKIQAESFKRAQQILSWVQSRVQRNLADESDLYQAQAAVAARELDLLSSQKKLEDSQNKMRQILGESLSLDSLRLSNFDHSSLQLLPVPAKFRRDLKAKRMVFEAQVEAAVSEIEKLKPELTLSGVVLSQGRDPEFSQARDQEFSGQDQWQISLQLKMPLNQKRISEIKSGMRASMQSQSHLQQAIDKDQNLTWQQTLSTAQNLKKQLQLVNELERIQKLKADNEQRKIRLGRSTAFQVLTFETDYSEIRAQKLQLELAARRFVRSLKLFE